MTTALSLRGTCRRSAARVRHLDLDRRTEPTGVAMSGRLAIIRERVNRRLATADRVCRWCSRSVAAIVVHRVESQLAAMGVDSEAIRAASPICASCFQFVAERAVELRERIEATP